MPTKHGASDSPEYEVWKAIRQRCVNPNNPRWARYGGRGITLCYRWQDFRQFIADMGLRPGPNYSIDRINNDGNYEPSNCRWATRTQQQRNIITAKPMTLAGETMCIAAWAERINVRPQTITARLHRGWPLEKALTTPSDPTQHRHVKRLAAAQKPAPER